MDFSNFPFKQVILSIFLLFIVTSCWDKNSPAPLTTNIKGTWRWTKTMDKDYNVIKSRSSDNSAYIQVNSMPYGSGFLDVLEFYENDLKIDSLYMPDTDNYNSSIQNENEIFVNYVDGQKKPVVARFKFFYPKNKSSASRMEMNIQKNTSKYIPEADTLITEYVRDAM